MRLFKHFPKKRTKKRANGVYPRNQRVWTVFPDWNDDVKGKVNTRKSSFDANKEKEQAKLGLRYTCLLINYPVASAAGIFILCNY